jgi:ATP-binding cassette subfamily C protein
LDYVVDEGSGNVSGGEKQKVSQARAFLKDAQVLILDEPTSALDMESIGNLKRILLDLRRDKIIIAISHHSGFCEVADEVVRLRPSALPERVHLCGRG